MIAPHLQTRADGSAWAQLPMANPTLVVAEPLQEVRLLRGQQLLWQRQAPEGQALARPLPWPLPPLRGGENLLLLLRPVGQSPGHFAPIELRAAPSAELKAHAALIQRLAGDGAAWKAAIEQQLLGGDVAEAWALLFAPEAPAQRELETLRHEVIEQGCGD